MTKRFRHLDYDSDAKIADLGLAAIDDLLDRGDLEAWAPLARAIRQHPAGELADMVLRLCEAHPMYGTCSMWRTWIARMRRAPVIHETVSLAQARIRLGLTQREVAERMGISQSDVSKLERRTDVRVSTLRAYMEALGTTLDLIVQTGDGDGGVSLRMHDD
jgi:DNA-binding Xre family transcriptional regulator